ncbi:hypothetical protein ACVXHB_27790 [Escherichia coli]
MRFFSRFAPLIPSAGSAVHPTWSTVSGLTLLTNSSSNGCETDAIRLYIPGEWISVWQVELPDVARKRIPTILPPYWKKS